MQAKDIMSREVVTVAADETVVQAAQAMLQRRFSGLPVVDAAGALVGIVTEGDFLRRVETGTLRRRPQWIEFLMGSGQQAAEYTQAAGRVVRDVMTRDVCTVNEDTPVQEIVDLMERHHVKRLPVMRGSELVGIVTRQDLVRALIRATPAAQPAAAGDDEVIRQQIVEALNAHSWVPLAIRPVVTNGWVKLVGTVFDDRQREALRVLVENVPGVKGVEDQLTWIEPMSGIVIEPRAA
jgi:CBS domain-containing protein